MNAAMNRRMTARRENAPRPINMGSVIIFKADHSMRGLVIEIDREAARAVIRLHSNERVIANFDDIEAV